jgi:hypothetical protein
MVGVAVALYLSLVAPQLGRPLIYDEVDFARAAASLAGSDPGSGAGPLRYDRGYIADYPTAPDAGQRHQVALWHPPGYLLLLGVWQRALPGAGDSSLRLFGALCGLGTLLLTAALGRLQGGALGAGLAALLWASSPFALQSALLLDVDGTVLPLSLALLSWLALRPGREPWSWPALAGAFALSLLCKLGPALVLGVLLTAWPAARGRSDDCRRTGGACLAGAGIAAGAWLLLASIYDLPPQRPLQDFSTALTQVATGVPLHLAYLVGAIRGAQWLHPLLVALLVAAPLALTRAGPGAALLFAGGALALLSLGKLAAGYPKYVAGPWPLLAGAAGGALVTWLSRERRPGARAALVVAGALAGAGLTTLTGADALIRGADLHLLALWLALGAGLLALALPLGPARPAALALGIVAGAGLTTSVYQATIPGSTTYFYRAGGQDAAGRWLADALRSLEAQRGAPGAPPLAVADREVAYHARAHHAGGVPAGEVHFVDTERWMDARSGRDDGQPGAAPLSAVRLVVTRHERAVALLPADSVPAGRFGDYRAWRLPDD